MSDTTQDTPPTPPVEPALAAALAEAEAFDGAGQQVAAAADTAAQALGVAEAEARELVQLLADLLLPLLSLRWPWLAQCYGPPQLERIAVSLAAVAVRRGWSMEGIMGSYGPEIALFAAIAGPVIPQLLAQAQAQRKAALSAAPAPAPVAEDGSDPEPAPAPAPGERRYE